jgi:hypothetical protein
MLALNSLIGFGADQFPIIWLKAVDLSNTTSNVIIQGDTVAVGSTATIAANFTFVQKILPTKPFLPGTGGQYVRVRLSGPPTGSVSTTFSACYIGNPVTSGDAYSFDGNQTQVTFNGSGSLVLPPTLHVKSDAIAPTTQIDWTKAVLLAFNVTSGSAYRFSTGLGTNVIAYAKTGVSEAATTDKGASYTSPGSGSGRLNFITGIETAS